MLQPTAFVVGRPTVSPYFLKSRSGVVARNPDAWLRGIDVGEQTQDSPAVGRPTRKGVNVKDRCGRSDAACESLPLPSDSYLVDAPDCSRQRGSALDSHWVVTHEKSDRSGWYNASVRVARRLQQKARDAIVIRIVTDVLVSPAGEPLFEEKLVIVAAGQQERTGLVMNHLAEFQAFGQCEFQFAGLGRRLRWTVINLHGHALSRFHREDGQAFFRREIMTAVRGAITKRREWTTPIARTARMH